MCAIQLEILARGSEYFQANLGHISVGLFGSDQMRSVKAIFFICLLSLVSSLHLTVMITKPPISVHRKDK